MKRQQVSFIIRSYLRRYFQDALESYHVICTSKLETGRDIKPHSAVHKTRKYRLGISKPGKIVNCRHHGWISAFRVTEKEKEEEEEKKERKSLLAMNDGWFVHLFTTPHSPCFLSTRCLCKVPYPTHWSTGLEKKGVWSLWVPCKLWGFFLWREKILGLGWGSLPDCQY